MSQVNAYNISYIDGETYNGFHQSIISQTVRLPSQAKQNFSIMNVLTAPLEAVANVGIFLMNSIKGYTHTEYFNVNPFTTTYETTGETVKRLGEFAIEKDMKVGIQPYSLVKKEGESHKLINFADFTNRTSNQTLGNNSLNIFNSLSQEQSKNLVNELKSDKLDLAAKQNLVNQTYSAPTKLIDDFIKKTNEHNANLTTSVSFF